MTLTVENLRKELSILEQGHKSIFSAEIKKLFGKYKNYFEVLGLINIQNKYNFNTDKELVDYVNEMEKKKFTKFCRPNDNEIYLMASDDEKYNIGDLFPFDTEIGKNFYKECFFIFRFADIEEYIETHPNAYIKRNILEGNKVEDLSAEAYDTLLKSGYVK